MEPRLPERLLGQLADNDRRILDALIRRYSVLADDIITYDDYNKIRNECKKEKTALRKQIAELEETLSNFRQDFWTVRDQLGTWTNWRKDNWDDEAGMTRSEKKLQEENAELRTEIDSLRVSLKDYDATLQENVDLHEDIELLRAQLPYIQRASGGPSHGLNWPWPITTPPEGDARRGDLAFPNKYSGLWLCGYRVGKGSRMGDSERCRFLDHFFRNPLPRVVSEFHGDSYGDPGSEKRLQKMANVMAANCRNFKRNNPDRYTVAITDYESDLEHLKVRYYRAGSFPWPPTED